MRTKKRTKKWKQQLFSDSGSGLDVKGIDRMLHDRAELIKEVPEGMKVLDFSDNKVVI